MLVFSLPPPPGPKVAIQFLCGRVNFHFPRGWLALETHRKPPILGSTYFDMRLCWNALESQKVPSLQLVGCKIALHFPPPPHPQLQIDGKQHHETSKTNDASCGQRFTPKVGCLKSKVAYKQINQCWPRVLLQLMVSNR